MEIQIGVQLFANGAKFLQSFETISTQTPPKQFTPPSLVIDDCTYKKVFCFLKLSLCYYEVQLKI